MTLLTALHSIKPMPCAPLASLGWSFLVQARSTGVRKAPSNANSLTSLLSDLPCDEELIGVEVVRFQSFLKTYKTPYDKHLQSHGYRPLG
jgi:hypothetical protein